MQIKTLYTWLGRTDLNCYEHQLVNHPGPVAQAVLSGRYSNIRILSNWAVGEEKDYLLWLRKLLNENGLTHKDIKMKLDNIQLSSPTDFSSIYESVSKILSENQSSEDRTYHLSPGTPAMSSIWIIISSGEFPASLISSSLEEGLKDVKIPFHIKADFISKALSNLDDINSQTCFEEIQSNSDIMNQVFPPTVLLKKLPKSLLSMFPFLFSVNPVRGKN